MSDILATLLSDPTRVVSVPRDTLPELIGEVEALKARLWAQLQQAGPAAPAQPRPPTATPDRLLTVAEAAERLGVSKRWVYRQADTLPFTRKLTEGTLRFSEKGLERWKESRK